MTENQWPQDDSFGTPAAAQRPESELRQSSTFPTSSVATAGTPSKTDTAKDEAGDVTRQAADSARNVTETAKTEAANVAGEVKSNAKDLLDQARTDLTAQAGTQQQKAAEGLRSISDELHSMASASDEPGVASDLVRQAAERSASVASWLDNRDPGSLLNEVKSFARRRPGAFLLAAAGAGMIAGRLGRSLSAGAPDAASGTATGSGAPATRVPDTGVAVPPPPVSYPETTTAGAATYASGAGETYTADTYPPNPLGAGEADAWAADPLAADPYRIDPVVDPDRKDPFDGGRR